jgi:DnaJ-class molecular chaperone
MKKILSVFAVAGMLINASAQDKKNESIEGNGKIVTRDINVQSFDALKASGVYELKLTQGDKVSVKIEADENLQELFTVKNDGSQLNIEMEIDALGTLTNTIAMEETDWSILKRKKLEP